MKQVFLDSTGELAKELAPPKRPVAAQFFSVEGESAVDGFPGARTRWRAPAPSILASVASTAYTLVSWTLIGLTAALLLLAANKVGSYRELPTALQQAGGIGSVISARVAASLPYLLGSLGTLAAAAGLFAIKSAIDRLWKGPVVAYQRALANWDSAYYCPTDRIVFVRTATSVHWDPVEELSRLIAKDWWG